MAPGSFSLIHSCSQFFLLSPLTPSCCSAIPLVLLGLQGDRTAGQHLVLSISQGPAPWAFRFPRGIIPASSNLWAGPRALRLSSCSSRLLWLYSARPGQAGQQGWGQEVSDPSPLPAQGSWGRGAGSHISGQEADIRAMPGSPITR